MQHRLECQACGERYEPGGYPRGCPACRDRGESGRLEVTYDPDVIDVDALPFGDGCAPADMWRYRELLPLLPDEPVSLGEGGTPLTQARRLSEETGATVLHKNETLNPTWSFKDRLYSLMLSNLSALGFDRVATSSTGNGGASAAAYARRAGAERTIVLSPHECEGPLRNQIRSYGAELVITDFAERGRLLSVLVDRGWYPAVNGLHYSSEGYKTIAFELVDQLGEPPDVIVFPAGIGDGLFGIWRGFEALYELDVIDRRPRMIGAQAVERQPLVRAFRSGADEPVPDKGPMPITISTSGTNTGVYTLEAVRESGGYACAIARADVERAIRDTGRDGIFVEPATALAPAGVRKAAEAGEIDAGETVVSIATGTGTKWPNGTEPAVGTPPTIEPTLEALRGAVSGPID